MIPTFRTGTLLLAFLLVLAPLSAQDAHQTLLDAVRANPKDPKAHFELGRAYYNDKQFDQAAAEFQKCVQIDPNDAQSREMSECSSGISEYFKKNFSSAADHFQKTLRINPQNPNANLLLADSYVQLRQYPNAESALRNYAAISPEAKAKAGEILAKIYMDQKRYPEAVVEYRNLVAGNQGNFEAYENLGVAYFQQKDFKNAAQAWESASKIKKDAQTYKFLGFSYYNLGNFPDAIDNYKRSISLESAKPPAEQNLQSLGDTHYNLAVAYNDNALFDQAAEEFAVAFKIDPKDSNAAVGQAQAVESATNAHMEKATNLLINNRYADAIAECNAVLKYQPDNKQASDFIADAKGKLTEEVEKRYRAGAALNEKGDTLGALGEWNQALQMDPQNERIQKLVKGINVKRTVRTKALIAEGDEHLKNSEYSEALTSYLAAKNISPKDQAVAARLKKLKTKKNSDIDAVYQKAMDFYGKDDLRAAQKYLTLAKQMDPNDPKVNGALFRVQKDITVRVKDLDQEGVSLFDSSREKAKERFQEVLKLKPNDETANDYIKRMTGQQSREKVNAELVKSLYYEGVNLYINGKINEAIAKWQECLNQDRGNVNAIKNIEKAKLKLQSIEKLKG